MWFYKRKAVDLNTDMKANDRAAGLCCHFSSSPCNLDRLRCVVSLLYNMLDRVVYGHCSIIAILEVGYVETDFWIGSHSCPLY